MTTEEPRKSISPLSGTVETKVNRFTVRRIDSDKTDATDDLPTSPLASMMVVDPAQQEKKKSRFLIRRISESETQTDHQSPPPLVLGSLQNPLATPSNTVSTTDSTSTHISSHMQRMNSDESVPRPICRSASYGHDLPSPKQHMLALEPSSESDILLICNLRRKVENYSVSKGREVEDLKASIRRAREVQYNLRMEISIQEARGKSLETRLAAMAFQP